MKLTTRLAMAVIPLLGLWSAGHTPSAHAAVIGEIFLDDQGERGVPHAVEVMGLHLLEADHAELLVVDARPNDLGTLHRVIHIPTTYAVAQVSESDWPEEIWGVSVNTNPANHTLAELGASAGFQFAFVRTLLLYDRPTGLLEHGAERVFDETGLGPVGEAELLDAITLVFPGGEAAADAPGPVFAVEPGDAIVWPLDEAYMPGPERVAGAMTDAGTLAGTEPPLRLSPGTLNPRWHPIPEPGTAVLLLVLAAGLASRRGGRCSHRRLGL